MGNKPARVGPSARVIANRRNGQRGGLATARKHGKDFCAARAVKAGQAVRDRYGNDFYKYIGKLRKNPGWKKGRALKKIPVIDDPVTVVLSPTDADKVVGMV